MGEITINGQTYSGNNLTIINNRVIIDGKDQTPDAKEITISVTGDVNDVSVDYCKEINVVGNVGKLKTTSGDVYCSDVTGGITTTSGDVECQDVTGDVSTTSGDISASLISGNVKTVSGDVRYKK